MPADDDRTEVLTSLPRSRPQRRSARRAGGNGETEPAEAKAAETKPGAAKKPRAAAKPRAASAGKTSAATSGASKPPKGGTARTRQPAPKAKAKAAPKAKAAARAKPTSPRTTAKPRPEAVTGPPREDRARPVEPPSSTDVLQSVVQAAGELTQVGVTIGREVAKSVIKRLPRL